jgi:hypothetical protein
LSRDSKSLALRELEHRRSAQDEALRRQEEVVDADFEESIQTTAPTTNSITISTR